MKTRKEMRTNENNENLKFGKKKGEIKKEIKIKRTNLGEIIKIKRKMKIKKHED